MFSGLIFDDQLILNLCKCRVDQNFFHGMIKSNRGQKLEKMDLEKYRHLMVKWLIQNRSKDIKKITEKFKKQRFLKTEANFVKIILGCGLNIVNIY